MPFDSNSELVKKVPGIEKLTTKKQNQFREVWNSCYEKGQPESQCFSTAWGVVKKAAWDEQILGPSETEGTVWDATLNSDILHGAISAAIREVRKAGNMFFFICQIKGQLKSNLVVAENEKRAEELLRQHYTNFPDAEIKVTRITKEGIIG